MESAVMKRGPFKRPLPAVRLVPDIVKRPAKRPMPADLLQKSLDKRPRWLQQALQTGEVRCPRKSSTIGIEACAQLVQLGRDQCVQVGCCFVNPGIAEAFVREAIACKTAAIPPKIGPRSKLRRVLDDFVRGVGDFAATGDEEAESVVYRG